MDLDTLCNGLNGGVADGGCEGVDTLLCLW